MKVVDIEIRKEGLNDLQNLAAMCGRRMPAFFTMGITNRKDTYLVHFESIKGYDIGPMVDIIRTLFKTAIITEGGL